MGMEPDVTRFLVRIMQTISMGLLWLMVNMTIGIYYDLAFFDQQPSVGNYIFYVWFVFSFLLLLFYFWKKWRKNL